MMTRPAPAAPRIVLAALFLAALGGAAFAQVPQTAPAASTQPADQSPDSLQTEAGRERLIELIKQQALEFQAKNPPAAGPATLNERSPLPPVATQPAGQAPGTPTTAATHPGGCGPTSASGINLAPPAPDQPQPKLVVKETTVVNEDVWTGQQATFEFDVTNDGQGPLAIRLRGG